MLYTLMNAVVDRYLPVSNVPQEELEMIEEQIFDTGSERADIRQLYPLKRKKLILKHAVVLLMEAIGKLFGGGFCLCAPTPESIFGMCHSLYRINTLTNAIRDTISMAIQVNLSMVAIEESEVNERLVAWAAIFAVATAFASIWGMNFKAMPELHWKSGYSVAIATMVCARGYRYYRFRKFRWL
ncbi:MAG: hypothetical protein NVSMB6_08290 [Burkholderiaceae bacterium]